MEAIKESIINFLSNIDWSTITASGFLIWIAIKLFSKSFIGKLGEQTAELLTTKQKTVIEETVKSTFATELEKFKSELEKKNIAYEADYTSYITERKIVCNKLYQALVDFYKSALQHTSIKTHNKYVAPNDNGEIVEIYMRDKDIIMDYYHKNKPYIPEDLDTLIIGFITTLSENCRQYSEAFSMFRIQKTDNQERKDASKQLEKISGQVDYMQHDLDKIADSIRKIIQPETEKQ